MVSEKFNSVSITTSGTARNHVVAAGTNRPKDTSTIQHPMWASGPIFAG